MKKPLAGSKDPPEARSQTLPHELNVDIIPQIGENRNEKD